MYQIFINMKSYRLYFQHQVHHREYQEGSSGDKSRRTHRCSYPAGHFVSLYGQTAVGVL